VSIRPSAHGTETVSLHPHDELERLCANLARAGAGALLLIDVEPLANIERHFGDDAHRRTVNQLAGLVSDLAREAAPGGDVFVTEDRGGDAILAFLFRSRSDREFYHAKLPELPSWISGELTRQGKRTVYPYHRDALALPVGFAVLLHNPNVNPERQIREAVDAARRDARLEAQVAARSQNRQLLQLILTGGLAVVFEPIVNLRSSEVIGYEALTRGPVDTDLHSPQKLFQQAKAGGLVYELDCLCRRTAFERARCLPRDKKLFLNCLPTSIGDPDLRDEGLVKILENYQLRPSDVVLEISEKESIENFAIFREMRDSWRDLGIQIAIDDAGAGYASLEAIMEITPDFLKADMGLVRGIDVDPPRQEVLRALKAVARRIGAAVIAEGVETNEELRVLRQLGIPYGQGYHFGPAVAPGTGGDGSDCPVPRQGPEAPR
jgi:EAL domain-containing protein (putative c-di-GMP-specific phosphodiesterase class I)